MISRIAIRGVSQVCNVARSVVAAESRIPSMTLARRLTESRVLFQDESKYMVGSKAEPVHPYVMSETETAAHAYGPGFHYKPSNLDKKMLVWTNIYEKVEDVPDTISTTQIKRARDWFRVRMNILMLIATAIGCFVMIKSGQQSMAAGENLASLNREWHRQINEAAKKE